MKTELTEKQRKDMTALLRKAGSNNKAEALEAQAKLAAALTLPLRSGLLVGSTIDGIFDVQTYSGNQRITFPIDLFRPENANDYKAYNIPAEGRIPERMIEGDELEITTYDLGNAIDLLRKYARDANFNVVARALEVLEAGFTQKINDDAWTVLMKSGLSRGFIVQDTNAAAGQFTKGLVSEMQRYMRRLGGGNTASNNRGRLTHLFVSPEAIQDMQNWDDTDVDEQTRREIHQMTEDSVISIYGVRIIPLDELGVDQPYQNTYTDVIAEGQANGGLASATDQELVIGLDATKNDSFIIPIRQQLEIFEDETLHRQRRMGWYGEMELGVSALNNARVLLGSF